MNTRRILQGLVALLVLLAAPRAFAVVCTLSGSVKVEPMDVYYCDTTPGLNCANWNEVNLDDKIGAAAAPMKWMVVEIRQSGAVLIKTATNASGAWSASFTLPGVSCTNQVVQVRHYFVRMDEEFFGQSSMPIRFALVDTDQYGNVGQTFQYYGLNRTLTGSSTTAPTLLFARSSSPTSHVRRANLLYTLNSALNEMITWSNDLDNRFSSLDWNEALRIGYSAEYTSGGGVANSSANTIVFDWDVYPYGDVARHELSHIAVGHMFRHDRDSACMSYHYNGDTNGSRLPLGCEWGSTATNEGLADFFAVRSITTNQNAFLCGCNDPANQDLCSENAASPPTDSDGFWYCPTGQWFLGVGDDWSNGTGTCLNLEVGMAGHCNCGTSCNASEDQDNGWRNALQLARFFWDLIDGNDEGGDDTDLTTPDFVGILQAMLCVGNYGGVDNSCEEQAPAPGGSCNPLDDTLTGPSGAGTRDQVNAHDIAALVPGSQEAERELNCVHAAQ